MSHGVDVPLACGFYDFVPHQLSGHAPVFRGPWEEESGLSKRRLVDLGLVSNGTIGAMRAKWREIKEAGNDKRRNMSWVQAKVRSAGLPRVPGGQVQRRPASPYGADRGDSPAGPSVKGGTAAHTRAARLGFSGLFENAFWRAARVSQRGGVPKSSHDDRQPPAGARGCTALGTLGTMSTVRRVKAALPA